MSDHLRATPTSEHTATELDGALRIQPFATRPPMLQVIEEEALPLQSWPLAPSDLTLRLALGERGEQIADAVFEQIDAIHSLPAGCHPVMISTTDDLPADQRGVFLPAGVDPMDMPRIHLAAGRSDEWVLIHEIGHWLDYHILNGAGFSPASMASPALSEWRLVVERSAAYGAWWGMLQIANEEQVKYLRYLLRPQELFARAYTQWVIERASHARWRDQIHGFDQRLSDLGLNLPGCWLPNDWAAVDKAMTDLFTSIGWIGPAPVQ